MWNDQRTCEIQTQTFGSQADVPAIATVVIQPHKFVKAGAKPSAVGVPVDEWNGSALKIMHKL